MKLVCQRMKNRPILGLPPVIGEVIPKVDPEDLAREVRLKGDVYDGKCCVCIGCQSAFGGR